MKSKALFFLAGMALLSFASCTDEVQEMEQPHALKQIVMTTEDFQPEAGSRTLYDIADGTVKCTWASNDTVGVFPDEGIQTCFPMTKGAGTQHAIFDGGGWALKDGYTYASYYPYIGNSYLDKHAVPVSYEGQTQVGNASMAHLGAYDYMVAAPVAPEFGSANFMFKHLSALVQLKITMPKPVVLNSVKLVAGTEAFAVKGKVDIMASTPGITSVTAAKEIKLTLTDVKTTKDNQVITLYMMLPPADLSTQTLKAVVMTDKGIQEMALENKNFLAGKVYALSGSAEDEEMVGNGTYKDGVVSLAEAGTMRKLLGDDYLNITSLKVVGPINGDDVYYLRNMLGGSNFSETVSSKLKTLDLSESSIVEGGEWYFELESIKYYTSNDVIGDYMFNDCNSLQHIVLPKTINRIGNLAFNHCDALTSIDIPDNVTELYNSAFSHCKALTTATLGDGITELSPWTFAHCDALKSVTISKNITTIGNNAFRDCDALSFIDIPNNVAIIEDEAFFACRSLSSLKIGDGVTTIGKYAFSSCPMSSVTMGKGIISIGSGAFAKCYEMESVYIKDLLAWCNIEFADYMSNPLHHGTKIYLDEQELTEMVIPDDVTEIKDYAFCNNQSIVKVTINDGVTTIGRGAFSGCNTMKSVTIGEGVTRIDDYAFYSCKGLNFIDIPHNVTSLGTSAFSGCESLISATIGDSISTIGRGAFSSCKVLSSVTIGKGCTYIAVDAFRNCDALVSIDIPDNVTTIDAAAFYDCNALTSVTLGKGVNEIRTSAFRYCKALTKIYCHATTPPSIETSNYSSFEKYGDKATVYVPARCGSKYKSSDWGNYFSKFVEVF